VDAAVRIVSAPASRSVIPGASPVLAGAAVPAPTQPAAASRECFAGVPLWLLLLFAIAITANVLAGATTDRTIDLMRSISPFAEEVRRADEQILPYWSAAWYAIATSTILAYLWPVIGYFRRGTPAPAAAVVQQRVVGAPAAVPIIGFIPWVSGVMFFPLRTLVRTGRWTPELLSQHVYSPLVNGFLAAATIYLLTDWLFRTMVVPRVFPLGRLPELRGARALGVRGRLLVFLVAVAFLPLFTMLGLVRAGLRHIEAGAAPAEVVARLASAGTMIFVLYVALGVVLTLVLAQTLTRPLACVADTLRRVRAGDLTVRANLGATDEIGLLEDGVNALVETLQDRERILHTFGRAVDPLVRDRLLASDAGLGGELRRAAVLFCDLRGFTAMAERTPPQEVVATLNAFFSTMTAWVRSCDGFVDKFIGDAMLVVFGLLEDTPDAGAGAALRCALGMRERLATLNEARAAAGQTPLLVSVGVHAGEVLAGRIGAEDRYEYTVIGDAVNVAARLQQLSKESAHAVLVSADAYELAAAAGVHCPLVQQDAVSLRGRRETIRVFALA
jgi:adenylate cyclase